MYYLVANGVDDTITTNLVDKEVSYKHSTVYKNEKKQPTTKFLKKKFLQKCSSLHLECIISRTTNELYIPKKKVDIHNLSIFQLTSQQSI